MKEADPLAEPMGGERQAPGILKTMADYYSESKREYPAGTHPDYYYNYYETLGKK